MSRNQVLRATEHLNVSSHYNFDPTYEELSCRVEKISGFLLIRRINRELDQAMNGYVTSKGITCLSIFIEAEGTIELDIQQRIAITPNSIVVIQADFCAFNLPMGSRLNTLELLFDTQALCQQGFDLNHPMCTNVYTCIRKQTSICISKTMSSKASNIANAIMCTKANDISSKLFVQAKALELLSEHMTPQYRPVPSIHHQIYCSKIKQASEYIKSHYQKPLTISLIARKFGVNEKKLKDGFRENFGTTVHKFIESTRLNAAKNLLEEGLKITDIAFYVGYSSASHFAKRFQKRFGKTPKNWQMTEPRAI